MPISKPNFGPMETRSGKCQLKHLTLTASQRTTRMPRPAELLLVPQHNAKESPRQYQRDDDDLDEMKLRSHLWAVSW